jgi:RNA polymerase sigma-54 factor
VKAIAKFQRDFFEKGIDHLKPMILRDVAEEIGMHESTVSRVTTNKYVQTPRGIYELKYFFNNGVATSEGDSVASETIKDKIRQMISQENPKSPHSDQHIAEMLKENKIDIARRTVAKYREMMGILPSSKRKQLF